MKQHFKKYGTAYQIILIALCLLLSCIFVYLGLNNKKKNKHRYTEEEAIGIMKLNADKLTRIIEIQATEGACDTSDPTTLGEKDMETYGFDKKLYKKVTYTMKCQDQKQIVLISLVGNGDFEGYQLTNYISNQKEESN